LRLFGNKSKKKRGAKRRPRAAAIICSVLGVVLLAIVAYRLWEKPPAHDESGLSRPSETAAPNGADATDSTADPDSQTSAGGTHNDAVYTFLVVGRDKVGANTDTILLGSLNTDTHAINVVSIPRDTLVNISCNIKKVNVLYEYDLNNGGNGVDGLLSGIRDLIGFNVDFYAVGDLEAFEKLVDAIGGVYYDVPVDMYYDDPTQDLHIAIPAGYQWLDGENALKVVRFRKGYANADIGRIGTQQDFLKAVAKQMLKLGNIPNLSKLSDIFTQYVDTDLTSANISFLARQFLLCKADDINFYTLPGDYADSVGGFSYVSLDTDQWLEMVNAYLNPWDQPVTVDNVNILTRVNGVLTATTGVIAGGADSFLTMQEYLASIGSSAGT
jgi:LCP family protein required for cell wall assembly